MIQAFTIVPASSTMRVVFPSCRENELAALQPCARGLGERAIRPRHPRPGVRLGAHRGQRIGPESAYQRRIAPRGLRAGMPHPPAGLCGPAASSGRGTATTPHRSLSLREGKSSNRWLAVIQSRLAGMACERVTSLSNETTVHFSRGAAGHQMPGVARTGWSWGNSSGSIRFGQSVAQRDRVGAGRGSGELGNLPRRHEGQRRWQPRARRSGLGSACVVLVGASRHE